MRKVTIEFSDGHQLAYDVEHVIEAVRLAVEEVCKKRGVTICRIL